MILRCTLIGIVFALSPGCSKKKNSQKEAPPTKKVPSGVFGLQALPSSTSVVMGLDWKAAAASPLIHRAFAQLFAADPGLDKDLSAFLTLCKLNPKEDVDEALLALIPQNHLPQNHPDSSAEAPLQAAALLQLRGRLNESSLVSCLGQYQQEQGERLVHSESEGQSYYQLQNSQGEGKWLAFSGPQEMMVATTKEAISGALRRGRSADNAFATGPLQELVARSKGQGMLWGAAQIDKDVGEGLIEASGDRVLAPKGVAFDFKLDPGMLVDVAVQMSSSKDAEEIVSQAKIQLDAASLILQSQGLGQLVQKIEFSSENHWAKLALKLTEEELALLVGANLGALGSAIDKGPANDENPAPKPSPEGEE